MADDLRSVSLPDALCATIEQRFSARFGGLAPFLVFVMQELLRDQAGEMDEAERRLVEERLKDLGYM
jgi:hypothetical protein